MLRFVQGLGDRAVVVLGNHDLHLVASALEGRTRGKDTFQDVLAAPDRGELLDWLRRRPLLHAENGFVLVHAGLPPQWSLPQALALADEARQWLSRPDSDEFLLKHMYGDLPQQWAETHERWERLRFVINCCTRLRFCTADGRVDLKHKGAPDSAAPGLLPWFAVPGRGSAGSTVLFGHWSTLGRIHWPDARVYGLDTGCVWGRELTALTLETGTITQVESRQPRWRDGD